MSDISFQKTEHWIVENGVERPQNFIITKAVAE